jgi:GT2 family glycosyltransferase/Tfp pilus assembly protein PilF
VLWLVDDNIFVNDFSLKYLVDTFKEHDDVLGLSLRLGKNTTYCYPLNKNQTLPQFTKISSEILKYDWRSADLDFNYPLEVSSSIYRSSDMLTFLLKINFINPNSFEGEMAANSKYFAELYPNILCMEKSLTFCNPINKVQVEAIDNRTSELIDYSAENLALKYGEGFRVDVDSYNGFMPNACHQEVELKLVRNLNFDKPSENPLVSIIIPCYNQAKYLTDALNSVVNQTYTNWECIIVNDGSKDNSSQVAKRIIKKNPNKNIKLYEIENSGLANARNHGISLSNGELVLPLDSDDVLENLALEKFVEALTKNGADIVYSNYTTFEFTNIFVKCIEPDEFYNPNRPENGLPYCSIYKKTLWEKTGGYNKNMLWGFEDWEFWINCSKYKVKVYKVTDALFRYRVKEQSMLTNAMKYNSKLRAQMILNNKKLFTKDSQKIALDILAKEPVISVIVPTYNRKDSLAEAIQSILHQTISYYEIVVVNDAGEDVVDVIKAFDDPRIKYYSHQTNKGLAATRNTGIENAKGKYIALLDDDDVYYPDHLETLVTYLEHDETKIAYTDAYRVTQEMQNGKYVTINKDIPFSFDFSKAMLLYQNIAPVQCFMFEKSCLDEIGLFDETLPAHEDWDIWIRLSFKYDFHHIKKITSEFRQRTDHSNMTTTQNLAFYNSYRDIVAKYYNFNEHNPGILNNQIIILNKLKQASINANQLMASNQNITVSIIIPVFNKVELTQKCLSALYKNTLTNIGFEVLIMNNASTDGTERYLEFAKMIFNNLIVGTNSQNVGFAKANNQAVKEAKGKYILFLNNDTEPLPSWLEKLLEVVRNDKQVAAVGSKLLFPDGSIQHAGVVIFNNKKENDPLVAHHIYSKEKSDHPDANTIKTYQVLTAACLLVRTEAFKEVGGFDEEYWNGYEDVDLCFKLRQKGKILVYQPESVVIHHESQSGAERFSRASQNISRLHKKWIGKITPDFIIEKSGEVIVTKAKQINQYQFSTALDKTFPKRTNDAFHPYVSIIVLTYNGLNYNKEFINSVYQNTVLSYELIIVDNGSTDGTREYLEELVQTNVTIKLIKNKENVGFPKGVNQAINISLGQYILIANNDIVVTKDWLERMVEVAETDATIGIAGPISNSVSGVQLDKGAKYNSISQMHKYAKQVQKKNHKKILEFPRVAFLCTLIKKEVIDKIGGLDERFSPGNFEDDDFCLRAQLAGYKTVIAQDVFIHHYGSKSFKANGVDEYAKRLECNKQIFIEKWGADPEEIWLKGKSINSRNPVFPIDVNTFTASVKRAMIYLDDKDYSSASIYLNEAIECFEKYSRKDFEQINLTDLLNLAANAALMTGDTQRAHELFEKELLANPSSSRACAGLGEAFLMEEKHDEAKTMLEWAIKNDPQNQLAKNSLKKVNEILGLPVNDNSLNEQKSVEEQVEELFAETYSLYEKKLFNESLAVLIELEKFIESSSEEINPETAVSIINLSGYNYLSLGNNDKARQSFEKALNIIPTSSTACAGLGEIFYLQEMDAEAKTMYEWGVKNDPNNQLAVNGLKKINAALDLKFDHNSLTTPKSIDEQIEELFTETYSLYEKKSFNESLTVLFELEKFVDSCTEEINPDTLISIVNLSGYNYLGLGDIDKARESFEKALLINPSSSSACAGLGEIFALHEMNSEAKTMFEWAVKNNPENQSAVSSLSKVNLKLGFSENHNSLIINNINPKRKIEEKLELAEELVSENKNDEAEALLQEVLCSEPTNVIALNNLSVIEILNENFENGAKLITKVLAINPEDEIALENMNYLKEKLTSVLQT